jgi:hypothetical protein
MKFSRKLRREGDYATVTIPAPVLSCWDAVSDVEMHFDESRNLLVVVPLPMDVN